MAARRVVVRTNSLLDPEEAHNQEHGAAGRDATITTVLRSRMTLGALVAFLLLGIYVVFERRASAVAVESQLLLLRDDARKVPVTGAAQRVKKPSVSQSRGQEEVVDDDDDSETDASSDGGVVDRAEVVAALRTLHRALNDASGFRLPDSVQLPSSIVPVPDPAPAKPKRAAPAQPALPAAAPASSPSSAGTSSGATEGSAYERRVKDTLDEWAMLAQHMMSPGSDPQGPANVNSALAPKYAGGRRGAGPVNAASGMRQGYIGWKTTHHTVGMGLGNRVLGMISTMALALATGRGFVLVDDTIISEAFDPAPVEAGGINMDLGTAQAAAQAAGVPWTEHHVAWGLGLDDKCGCEDYLDPGNPSYGAPTIITMETTQYLSPCFVHNPHLRQWYREKFGDAVEVFRPLLTRFFRLKPALQAELDRFDQQVFHPAPAPGAPAKRRHVIGLQIRSGHLIRARHEEENFYRCASQLSALAQMGRSTVPRHLVPAGGGSGSGSGSAAAAPPQPAAASCPDPPEQLDAPALPEGPFDVDTATVLDSLIDALGIDASELEYSTEGPAAAAKAAAQKHKGGKSSKARAGAATTRGRHLAAVDATAGASLASEAEVDVYYFIASDSKEIRQRARQRYGDRLIEWSPGPSSGNLPPGAGAVLDTWLLSRCDDIILTYPKSTFGFVGAALHPSGLPPHVVVSGSKRSSECMRLITTEPVFHGWFMRWFARCYERGITGWETGAMLNQENAYHCIMDPKGGWPPNGWGVWRCPAGDAADAYMMLASPFEYEAVMETPDEFQYWGSSGLSKQSLTAPFEATYEQWVARAGRPWQS